MSLHSRLKQRFRTEASTDRDVLLLNCCEGIHARMMRIIFKHTGLINASWAGLMQLPAPSYLCQMLSGQNALLRSFVNVFFPSTYLSYSQTLMHPAHCKMFYIYIYIYIHIYYVTFLCFLGPETLNIQILKVKNAILDHPPREWNHNEGSSWQLLVLDPEQVCLTCANGSELKQVGWNFDEGKNTKHKGNVALETAPLAFLWQHSQVCPQLAWLFNIMLFRKPL